MRAVTFSALISGVDTSEALEAIARFDRYPQLAPHVQSTQLHETLPGPTGSSSWELHFRSGLLRWTESEQFDLTERRITFTQSQGDFDQFSGTWAFHEQGVGTRVDFDAEFDFGISSLEGILDPIAERVIRETVAWAVVGMFDDVVILRGDFESDGAAKAA